MNRPAVSVLTLPIDEDPRGTPGVFGGRPVTLNATPAHSGHDALLADCMASHDLWLILVDRGCATRAISPLLLMAFTVLNDRVTAIDALAPKWSLWSWRRQDILTDMGVVNAEALPSNPIDALRELAVGEAELDRLRRATMTAARANGATWEQIGEALGMTRQSAWEYLSRETRAALSRNVAKNDELTEAEAIAAAVEEVSASRRARVSGSSRS